MKLLVSETSLTFNRFIVEERVHYTKPPLLLKGISGVSSVPRNTTDLLYHGYFRKTCEILRYLCVLNN